MGAVGGATSSCGPGNTLPGFTARRPRPLTWTTISQATGQGLLRPNIGRESIRRT